MTSEVITSMQNPNIKKLLTLQQKSSERRRSGLFVVEGKRELQHCINAGLTVETIFWCEAIEPEMPAAVSTERRKMNDMRLLRVSEEVYEKIAYRGTTEGIVACVYSKKRTLNDLTLPDNPLIIVLESVEKPGNLGAILRSADAAAVDAVIVCDPLTDLYNPNLIRSSIGASFTVPLVACSSEECIAWLKANNIRILTAQLQDSKPYYDTDMTLATAIIMGAESTGLTSQWREAANAHINIPMRGQLDSLNVSVSAAILMYEAVRQRLTI